MFSNINQCRSFNQVLTNTLVKLSAQECSEVIVANKTGQGILIFDNNNTDATNGFLLSANDTFTFAGVSDCEQLSAKTVTGTGTVYYRTQMFSNTPSR